MADCAAPSPGRRNQFEVFFYPSGLRVFPMDAAGTPIEAAGLRGTATFYHPNSQEPWFSRPIEGGSAAARQGQSSLDLAIELTGVPPAGTRVAFAIAGLPDTPSFTLPFELAGAASANAAAPEPAAAPRFVFGPGANGFGYYQAPVSAAPAARPVSGGRPATRTRDWSTGQNLPTGGLLSKPWLKPSR